MLWHLKREVELSHLAQEAVEWDRRSPHAWTIMGNCFSLQKVYTIQHHHCMLCWYDCNGCEADSLQDGI